MSRILSILSKGSKISLIYREKDIIRVVYASFGAFSPLDIAVPFVSLMELIGQQVYLSIYKKVTTTLAADLKNDLLAFAE